MMRFIVGVFVGLLPLGGYWGYLQWQADKNPCGNICGEGTGCSQGRCIAVAPGKRAHAFGVAHGDVAGLHLHRVRSSNRLRCSGPTKRSALHSRAPITSTWPRLPTVESSPNRRSSRRFASRTDGS